MCRRGFYMQGMQAEALQTSGAASVFQWILAEAVQQRIIFHDKRACRILPPGGIVLFHQIIAQLRPVLEF